MEGKNIIKRLIENQELLAPETEPNPLHYKNITRFYEILEEKKEFGEKIYVIGHEDLDGIASLYGIELLLKELEIEFKTYLPSRENESYGVSNAVIERFVKENFDFLITVDCGLSNSNEIKLLRELGYDIFIIDHHSEGNFEEENLIHPFLGIGFPFLSNAVLVFVILFLKFGERLWKEKKFLDFTYLSGLSVLSDKVPPYSVNGFVLKKSQLIFQETEIYKVFTEVNTKPPEFRRISRIIPFISARNGTHLIIEFLREKDEKTKRDIMSNIISKYIEEQGKFEESLFNSKNCWQSDDRMVFIISKNINPRYAGWVASRFLKESGLPSICIAKKGNRWVGEARSKPPLSVLKILKETSYLFEEFGGHPFACGFSIREENIEPLLNNLKILSKRISNFIPEPDLFLSEDEFKKIKSILEKIGLMGITVYFKVDEKMYYTSPSGILEIVLT
ncbi:MAG: DHH family phosphoesterase [Candidatus Hydrothermales bacterium]